jgi:hypothetical protein
MNVDPEDTDVRPEDALQSALARYFAARQLQATAALYLYGAAMPTLVLWVNAWHPLADLVTWFAALGWAMCVVMTLSLTVASHQRRLPLFDARPEWNRVARLHFAPSRDTLPHASTILIGLAAATSIALWLHAVAPSLLGAGVLQTSSKTWIVFVAGAVVSRILELA